jgi:hypothetical protein
MARARSWAVRVLVFLTPLVGLCQWQTQDIPLQPGWNAVFLQVQPGPASCASVLTNLPVETVWKWQRHSGLVEFNLDPGTTFPRPGDWKIWFPPTSPERYLSTFTDFEANEAYLIKLPDTSSSYMLHVKGVPRLSSYLWAGQAYSLYGLPVPESSPPTFTEFFSFGTDIKTSFLDGGRLYSILPSGRETMIYQPTRDLVLRGAAYWVLSSKVSQYSGPFANNVDGSGNWLDFGTASVAKTVRVRNITAAPRVLRLQVQDSESAPAGEATVAGRVPLVYGVRTLSSSSFATRYATLPSMLETNLSASQEIELQIRPDSSAISNVQPNSVYGAVLVLSDKTDTDRTYVKQYVGVRYQTGARLPGDLSGLWVGTVAVGGVNHARIGTATNWDTETIQAVGKAFSFRVLINVESSNTAHLVQRAFIGWVPTGEMMIGGIEDAYTVGTQTNLFSESEADAFLAANPNGKVRRISSVNFPFMDPVLMDGSFGGTNTLMATVNMDYRDPVNPFLHRYNPDHDNLEYRNDVPVQLAEGIESYTIVRQFSFSFSQTDADGGRPIDWGITKCGGTYRETISGLHAPIKVEGLFVLERLTGMTSE